jgi:hypothetical protein
MDERPGVNWLGENEYLETDRETLYPILLPSLPTVMIH